MKAPIRPRVRPKRKPPARTRLRASAAKQFADALDRAIAAELDRYRFRPFCPRLGR